MKDKAKEFEKGWEQYQAEKIKQIEEMAKIIDDRLIEARGYLGSMNKGEGYWIAQKLIEHYQPKIDKDKEVVLSRKEYEQKNFALRRLQAEKNIIIHNLSIATKNLLDFIHYETFHKGYELKKVERKVKELAKELGVEVEE